MLVFDSESKTTVKGEVMGYTLKNVSEVAAILGCKPVTVYRLVKSGKIPHRRIGKFLRFSDQDMDSFLESVKVEKVRGKYGA